MKLTPADRAARIARITRDVCREAYPAPPDPSLPLVMGPLRRISPVIVARPDFVALAEELAEVAALRARVAALEAGNKKLHSQATNLTGEVDELKAMLTLERSAKEEAEHRHNVLTQRRFPVLGAGFSIPWALIAPFDAQARRNHSQSLERLAERGGLCSSEIWCVVHGMHWGEGPPAAEAREWCLRWAGLATDAPTPEQVREACASAVDPSPGMPTLAWRALTDAAGAVRSLDLSNLKGGEVMGGRYEQLEALERAEKAEKELTEVLRQHDYWRERAGKVAVRVVKLEAALVRYGSHEDECVNNCNGLPVGASIPPCECGFDEALAIKLT